MDLEDIRNHWSDWATSYGVDLRATTRGKTAKWLELDAFRRRLTAIVGDRPARVLEVGCGNGINCIELAKAFPQLRFDGVDYIEEMVEAARVNAREAGVEDRVTFRAGNVLKLDAAPDLAEAYDVIITDRCLINLNTPQLQGQGIAAIAGKLKPEGWLLMIENSTHSHARQNDARELLKLERRQPSEFNRFFSEAEMRSHIAAAGLGLVEIEDFSSLHDLVLYSLLPATNGGKVDYDDPVVAAAARLSIALAESGANQFGDFGQNRLYVTRVAA